ncbi:MAG: hypothetical protein ACI4NE_08090 [Succinivibrio sp.]
MKFPGFRLSAGSPSELMYFLTLCLDMQSFFAIILIEIPFECISVI